MQNDDVFPDYVDSDTGIPLRAKGGLTRRELFSAMALEGMMADPNTVDPYHAAKAAVRYADALLAELDKE